jgi:hypothetical protein
VDPETIRGHYLATVNGEFDTHGPIRSGPEDLDDIAARVARAVADDLQLRGYDVYGVGSTPDRYERTTVADLRDPAGTRAGNVARSLAVRRRWWRFYHGPWLVPDTTVAIDSSRFVDVRLIVGDDYQTYFPKVIPLY